MNNAAAQCGERRNDCHRDQGAGHSILNRGQTFFVAQEVHEFCFHLYYYHLFWNKRTNTTITNQLVNNCKSDVVQLFLAREQLDSERR